MITRNTKKEKEMSILDVKMEDNDASAKDIRGYFHALLKAVWQEGECFCGKRPFGNSGWEYDLYEALVKAGKVKGDIDDDGYLNECDTKTADKIIFDAIDECFEAQS